MVALALGTEKPNSQKDDGKKLSKVEEWLAKLPVKFRLLH